MRILDYDSDTALKNVTLFLALNEAKELKDALEYLMSDFQSFNHAHITDAEYVHEITIATHDETDIDGFSERAKKIIQEDK
ncbi:MAG: hypothetical protein FWE69_00340 [Clostridiales bacterium]|nr:hypothetical protein [Clostridiales bacterium]